MAEISDPLSRYFFTKFLETNRIDYVAAFCEMGYALITEGEEQTPAERAIAQHILRTCDVLTQAAIKCADGETRLVTFYKQRCKRCAVHDGVT